MPEKYNLSMLAGYGRKKSNPVQTIERSEATEVEETIIDDVETIVETPTEEITVPELEVTEVEEETKTEETEDETKTEELESEDDEDDEDEGDLDISMDDLSDDEKKIVDVISEVYKKSWKKSIDELSQTKWFDKVMSAVEDQFRKHYDEKKELEESKQSLESEIQSMKKSQLEQKKEWELEKMEIQRYKLDEDDEYILDLKKKLGKDKEDETLRRKLRDEYLRAIAEVDPEFDMFEYRKRIEAKKTTGIENLSWSNRSTAPVITEDKPKVLWHFRRT